MNQSNKNGPVPYCLIVIEGVEIFCLGKVRKKGVIVRETGNTLGGKFHLKRL